MSDEGGFGAIASCIAESMSLMHAIANNASCNVELVDIDAKLLTLLSSANASTIALADVIASFAALVADSMSLMQNVMSFPDIPS